VKKVKLKRGPQIITPKDASIILSYTGAEPGSKVVDAGSGSGFLAIFLARYLNPGKVYTYEKDERFIKIAKENFKRTGLKNIVSRKADITEGIREKNVDLITLDLKDADKVIKHAESSLKKGGMIAIYSPTIDHLERTLKELKRSKFIGIRIVEGIMREWKHDYTLRPKTKGIMHTGLLIFAKKK